MIMNSLQRPSETGAVMLGRGDIWQTPDCPEGVREKAAVKAGDKTVSGQACAGLQGSAFLEKEMSFSE